MLGGSCLTLGAESSQCESSEFAEVSDDEALKRGVRELAPYSSRWRDCFEVFGLNKRIILFPIVLP